MCSWLPTTYFTSCTPKWRFNRVYNYLVYWIMITWWKNSIEIWLRSERDKGLGNNQVSCWNVTVCKFCRYYNNFQNFYVLLYLERLSRESLGTRLSWLNWRSFLHQHWGQHSSTQDAFGQGFSPDPSSWPKGSGVQTKEGEGGITGGEVIVSGTHLTLSTADGHELHHASKRVIKTRVYDRFLRDTNNISALIGTQDCD